METKGIYIYGIVEDRTGTTQVSSPDHSKIYGITHRNITAIVSDWDAVRLQNLDRESLGYLLVQHQQTIEDLMKIGYDKILPMRLGTILNSREDVLKILACGHDLMNRALRQTESLFEIDLAVMWTDFVGTLNEIGNHPDIEAMKEDIKRNINTFSQDDQVKVGMLIKEILDKRNKQIELEIIDALSIVSLDVKMHPAMNDQMVTNSAFLIHKSNKEIFEQIVERLDEEHKRLLSFKLVGPLPCYSFYTIEVKELDPEHVAFAKNELGLTEETSVSEIKKAYLEKARLFHPDVHPESGDEESFNRINKAYHTLLDYSEAAKQLLKEEFVFLSREKVLENLILVKIRE